MRTAVVLCGISAIGLAARVSSAQDWCAITTAKAYSPLMPGITSVMLGSLHRVSAPVENPANSYVLTRDTLTLTAGESYAFSIAHTRDSVAFPRAGNSIRVWIDYDKDGSFGGPKELVVSGDALLPGGSMFLFTVPRATSPVTATRMRITAKMSTHTGHTDPTPCDDPPDRFGYHGEVEDYTVNVLPAPPRPARKP
jgi:hypothetical protein